MANKRFAHLFVEPPVFDETIVRKYAETHTPEQTRGYVDGILALREYIDHMLYPRFKDGSVDTTSGETFRRLMERFMEHGQEIFEKLNFEFDAKKNDLDKPSI